jgi:hypothetical protein
VLRHKFRRLYDLLENQAVTVDEMCTLGWGDGEDGL